jgi:hypothetical protein
MPRRYRTKPPKPGFFAPPALIFLKMAGNFQEARAIFGVMGSAMTEKSLI